MNDKELINEIISTLYLGGGLNNLNKRQAEYLVDSCLREFRRDLNEKLWNMMVRFEFSKDMGHKMDISENGKEVKRLFYYLVYGEELNE